MRKIAILILGVMLLAAPAFAQQELNAVAVYMGTATITTNGTQIVMSTSRVMGVADFEGDVKNPAWVSWLSKWAISEGGGADFRSLTVDELYAKSFIVDLEQALAGGQIISKSVTLIGAPFTMPSKGGSAAVIVQDLPSAPSMRVFVSGDYVRMRVFERTDNGDGSGGLLIADAWGTVTSYIDGVGEVGDVDYAAGGDGTQQWMFTRLAGTAGVADGGGMMPTGTVVPKDSIVLDYGVSGNGFYEVSAIDGFRSENAPYAQIVTWAGASPYSANQTLRTRFGNLHGVTTTDGEYGMLAGTYAATNGQYFRASNAAFELHGIDLSLWDGTSKTFLLNHATPSLAMGSTLPSAYATGTGVWMGKDSGTYKFRVGTPGGAGIFWDGTNLAVHGTLTVTSNAGISGFNYAASASAGGSATDTVNVNGVAASVVQGGSASAIAWRHANNATLIDGGDIYSGSVTTSALNFTPITGSNVVATINASAEGLRITGDRIAISGSTTFTSGYDPSAAASAASAAQSTANTAVSNAATAQSTANGKLAPGSAASDVNAYSTTINGGKITTGSITATQIAASTITADRMNVSSLSALSANIGTITSGTISGTTINAGSSNQVTLNSGGISITSGASGASTYKFDGSMDRGMLWNGGLFLMASSSNVIVDATALRGSASLGTSGMPWNDFYFTPGSTTDANYPLVISGNRVLQKTDGCTGGPYNYVDVDAGIVVGCGNDPSPETVALQGRVQGLESQVSSLSSQVSSLSSQLSQLQYNMSALLAQLQNETKHQQ